MHTSHLLLSATLKRTCSLPSPLRPPYACLRAPCSAHWSDHVSQQNRTSYRGAAMESKIGADRTVLVWIILCYHKDGRRWSAHPARARALARHCQRLAEGVAPSRITPAIPTGFDPSSIRRYEWRRQKARRDITTQSPSCVGPMMNVTFEPCRRLRTDEDWCRAPAVYCVNM